MLAIHPHMASHPHSQAFSSQGPSLLRQPSAEDIDAAHQLVSSARGERTGTFLAVNHDQSNTPKASPTPQPQIRVEDGAEAASPRSTEESQQLGQVCR